jgi:hypothetical protein
MRVTGEDLQWFTQHYHVDVHGSNAYRYRTSNPVNANNTLIGFPALDIEKDRVFKLEIGEQELIEIISILQKADTHLLLQNRYPGIREAYMNYITTIMLTADMGNSNKIY